IEADDQAIQTILFGLREDIYAAVDSCETAQEIWLRVQQMMKGSDIGIQEKNAKFTSNEGESIESCYHRFLKLMNDLKRNKHFPEKIANIINSTTAMNMALVLMAKTFKLNYSTPTNNNQRISSNPKNRQIAQPGMNMGQDRQMQMIGGNGRNQFRQYARQNAGNPAGYDNDMMMLSGIRLFRMLFRIQEFRMVLAKWKPDKVLQLQGKEYDLMAAAADLDEIEEVNANCILMANLQQASTSGTQTDSAPVYDTDGSAEVHENSDGNDKLILISEHQMSSVRTVELKRILNS
nr:hypothetical protein [Tanacetum cinerariifolium]